MYYVGYRSLHLPLHTVRYRYASRSYTTCAPTIVRLLSCSADLRYQRPRRPTIVATHIQQHALCQWDCGMGGRQPSSSGATPRLLRTSEYRGLLRDHSVARQCTDASALRDRRRWTRALSSIAAASTATPSGTPWATADATAPTCPPTLSALSHAVRQHVRWYFLAQRWRLRRR